MKWILMSFVLMSMGNVFAEDQAPTNLNEVETAEVEIQKDNFSDADVSKALETAESTLDKIGRDIASEGEIEVVE